jgi:hypothetical protein
VAVTVPWLLKPFTVVEQCFSSENVADEIQCSEPGTFGIRKAFRNQADGGFNKSLNQMGKYRVNQIGEVHCRRRKRREERESGLNLPTVGSRAQS